MKTWIWVTTSLILHFCLGVGLVWTRSAQPVLDLRDVVDLSVLPLQTAPLGKSNQDTLSNLKKTPKKAASALAKDSKNNKAAAEIADQQSEVGETSSLPSQPLSWGDVTTLPKLQKEIKATYPDSAKSARIEGPVIADITINQNGTVQEVLLVQGPGYGLNESAVEALRKFEFSPALKGTEKVAVKIRYTYRFKLGVN